MNTSIQLLIDTATKIGLSVNPKKCYSLHINEDHSTCLNTEFKINNTPAAILFNYDVSTYLGKPFGFHIAPDSNDINDYINTGKKIINSQLAPWQKLDALKTFLYPSFHYAYRINKFAKKDWDALDKALKPLIKKTLHLPQRASTEYLYGDSKSGLFGIPLASDDCPC